MADELNVRDLCSSPDYNANQGREHPEVSIGSMDGETGSLSEASSCESFDMGSMSSEATYPESGYCRLAWRAEMTPGAVSMNYFEL